MAVFCSACTSPSTGTLYSLVFSITVQCSWNIGYSFSVDQDLTAPSKNRMEDTEEADFCTWSSCQHPYHRKICSSTALFKATRESKNQWTWKGDNSRNSNKHNRPEDLGTGERKGILTGVSMISALSSPRFYQSTLASWNHITAQSKREV